MKKYQEAFNELKHIIKVQSIDFDEIRYQKVEKYLNLLSELVDKETTKQPYKQFGNTGFCPKCHSLVHSFYDYCCCCGQRLEWSEEDEKED